MDKSILKLKEKDKATSYSPSRMFVVYQHHPERNPRKKFAIDSGASMHMQDLKSVELDSLRTSRNPTWAITANGEVQTNKKATVCGHDLNFLGKSHHDPAVDQWT